MIHHIFKIIWTQRRHNAWIWAELLLASVCLWYIVDDLYSKGVTYVKPLGFDITDTYLIEFQLLLEDSKEYHSQEEYGTTLGEDLLTIAGRLRSYPGIEYVSISQFSSPYGMMLDFNGMERINQETNDTLRMSKVNRRMVTPDYFNVFRFTSPTVSTQMLAESLIPNNYIISKEVENALYPEGNASGKFLSLSPDSIALYIAGVTDPIRRSEFMMAFPVYFVLFSDKQIAEEINSGSFPYTEICVRVSSQASKNFVSRFRKEMKNSLKYHNIYMLDITPFDKIRGLLLRMSINDTKMYLSVLFFLLANIFLGITGTFWLRTQQRQSEMGLRVALGSTTPKLRSILIGEGLILFALASLPALLISLNIGIYEIVDVEQIPFTFSRFVIGQGITFLLMSVMITFGIWFPSRKATHIQPAEALLHQ